MSDSHERLNDFAHLVRSRRSNLRVAPDEPVDLNLVRQLCEIAVWAPNHKRTSPWRFAVFSGRGRVCLGDALVSALRRDGEPDDARLERMRSKYLRAPVVVVVASAANDDETLHNENRDAVAAGIQTMLLGATVAGLASMWATGEVVRAQAVKDLCGFRPDDQVVGVVYLGWPLASAPPGGRPPPVITIIDG